MGLACLVHLLFLTKKVGDDISMASIIWFGVEWLSWKQVRKVHSLRATVGPWRRCGGEVAGGHHGVRQDGPGQPAGAGGAGRPCGGFLRQGLTPG